MERVTRSAYLGGLMDDVRRMSSGHVQHSGESEKCGEKSIYIRTNMKLYYASVVLVLLRGSECWCLRKEDERRLLVAEKSLGLRRIIGRSRR